MNDPQLYEKHNSTQRRDTKEVLENYAFKWKEANARVLDIGCGDGSVTATILKKYLPNNFMKLVACDINPNSVKFARERYESEKVQFMTLDIQEPIPDKLKQSFDHIFSFYTFHWVRQQISAFSNVYEMLAEGGNTLLIFIAHSKSHEVFDELSRMPKWSADLKDVRTKFISPYSYSKDPESEIRSMMERIGFKNVDVQLHFKTCPYEGGVDDCRMLMKIVNPFRSLDAKWDEFMEDYIKVDPDAGILRYELIVAYGMKGIGK